MSKKPTGSAGFDLFWGVYPRCVAKPQAKRAYDAAIKDGATHDSIMTGLRSYPFSPDPNYIPHPATWLRGRRFEGIILRDAPTIAGASSRLSWRDRYDHGAGVLTGLGADRVPGSMAKPLAGICPICNGYLERPGSAMCGTRHKTGPTGFRQNGQERITGPVVSGQRGNQADFDDGEFPF